MGLKPWYNDNFLQILKKKLTYCTHSASSNLILMSSIWLIWMFLTLSDQFPNTQSNSFFLYTDLIDALVVISYQNVPGMESLLLSHFLSKYFAEVTTLNTFEKFNCSSQLSSFPNHFFFLNGHWSLDSMQRLSFCFQFKLEEEKEQGLFLYSFLIFLTYTIFFYYFKIFPRLTSCSNFNPRKFHW